MSRARAPVALEHVSLARESHEHGPALVLRTRDAFVRRWARAASLALILAATVGACAYSREGWGRGRFVVVHEAENLQVRRSTIRVDAATGDVVMNWIGVRAPTGRALVAEASLVVFEDLDADGRADSDEIRAAREAQGPGEKILFSDVRVARGAWRSPDVRESLTSSRILVVVSRSADGSVHFSSQPFVAD